MARTKHLQLYSDAYVFVRELYRARVKLPKILKHNLGQEAFRSALQILKFVVIANRSHEKNEPIAGLLTEIEVQWAMLRLLYV